MTPVAARESGRVRIYREVFGLSDTCFISWSISKQNCVSLVIKERECPTVME
jgi:hypothetical protein